MNLEIRYTTQIWREGDQFIAHAMPLDVAGSGMTPEEARKALDETVRLFLMTAVEHGTFGEVLADAGYENRDGQWCSPEWIAVERGDVALSV